MDMGETILDQFGGMDIKSPPAPMLPPRLEDSPPFPQPGIYFGMSDEEYHSIHACSASGLKELLISSMDYWACSVLNPNREDDDTIFKALGRAYHIRILMGSVSFRNLYTPALTQKDFGDAEVVTTIKQIRAAINSNGGEPKGAAKGPLMAQLRELNPSIIIWDREVAEHADMAEEAGQAILPAKEFARIEIAAAMIEKDEELSKAFTGGHAEVALFWFDEATGVPCKCKVDYLKLNSFTDLKSFGNTVGRPIERAIDFAIANQKHYIPVAFYSEGIAAVKKLVREQGLDGIMWAYSPSPYSSGPNHGDKALREWVWQWAHQPDAEVLFVYQKTGNAPVSRGRIMTKRVVFDINRIAVQQLKKKWRRCAEAFGTDPWIDAAPIRPNTDDELPASATDLGEIE